MCLAAGPAIASADDEAYLYATANFGANFMSDQSERLSGDGPTQSGDASLGSGLLTSDGLYVQLLAGARYEIGEQWFLDAGLRYLSAGEVTMDGEGAATGRVRADYEPWSATVGVGWRF